MDTAFLQDVCPGGSVGSQQLKTHQKKNIDCDPKDEGASAKWIMVLPPMDHVQNQIIHQAKKKDQGKVERIAPGEKKQAEKQQNGIARVSLDEDIKQEKDRQEQEQEDRRV